MRVAIIAGLLTALGVAAPSASAVLSDWHTNVTNDPMTDKAEAQALVITDEGALSFLCDSTGGMIMVQPNAYLGGSLDRYDLRRTYVRFDDGQPEMTSWKYHDKHATTYSDKETLAFVTRMKTSKQVRIRLTSFDRTFIDLAFPLENAMPAIQQAYEACAGK